VTIAWRITQREFWHSAFSGEGSRIFGGRWNSKGLSVVYLADTVALAQLELLVHVSRKRLAIMDLGIARVEFDERLVADVADKDMPDDWQQSLWPASTQELGNKWLQEKSSPILRVPSSVSPTDFNCLLNPLHADFHKITIHPFRLFSFNPRLMNDA